MRPVNLLPVRYRPRTGGGEGSKLSYVALGALGLLVLAVFGYVMTANKVSSRNSEIAQTRAQIQETQSRAVTLKGFGDFASLKQSRLAAVTSLATQRLDWERLFRELAHVLPAGVWLTEFDGNATASSEGSTDAQPGLVLKGCAKDHRQIADVLVRLRELHVAEDVELTKTITPEESQSSGSGSGGESSGCGDYFSFEIAVTMGLATAGVEGDTAKVPARLGGGA